MRAVSPALELEWRLTEERTLMVRQPALDIISAMRALEDDGEGDGAQASAAAAVAAPEDDAKDARFASENPLRMPKAASCLCIAKWVKAAR